MKRQGGGSDVFIHTGTPKRPACGAWADAGTAWVAGAAFTSAPGRYGADAYKDISHCALIKPAKFYGVTADYLLGLSETKNHPNADLADLRLRDEMIDLLKSGRIDPALLCELAAHPDLVKLPADIQIYVAGIAATQMQNLNAWVDVASAIVEKYQPGEHMIRPPVCCKPPMCGRATISAAGYITILTLS